MDAGSTRSDPENRPQQGRRHEMTRRRFLVLGGQSLVLAACSAGGTLPVAAKPGTCLDHTQALELGRCTGVGSVALIGPSEVDAASWQCFEFIYTVGRAVMAPGSAIRIAMRHVLPWSPAQTDRKDGPGFVRAFASNSSRLSVVGWNDYPNKHDLFRQHHPWQNVIEIVCEKGMPPGSQIRVVYGDRSLGGPGTRVQMFSEPRFRFRAYADVSGQRVFLPCEPDLSIRIRSLSATDLNIVAPGETTVRHPTSVVVGARDAYGNQCSGYTGQIAFSSTDSEAALPDPYEFSSSDDGHKRFESIRLRSVGYQAVSAADNTSSARSNPIRVDAGGGKNRLLLWGDLHGHSLLSDGRGEPEEYYRFARDVACLDVSALTDHDFLLSDERWDRSKRVTNDFYEPGSFVTLQGYEWSGLRNRGGDHNVYFIDDDPPLYRCNTFYDKRNQHEYHGPTPRVDHVMLLYRVLLRNHGERSVLAIPHHGGRTADPLWQEPRLQRLVEMFSDHGRFEAWAIDFQKRGHRLGFLGSSDTHIGRPGFSYLPWTVDTKTCRKPGKGLVGIYSLEKTREAVFDALYDRRVYATSGERIVLSVNADGHDMGSEYAAEEPVELRVEVMGTDDIAVVEVFKNNRAVYQVKPAAQSCGFTWTDNNFQGTKRASYFLRVSQVNGGLAVSSPIWVTSG